MCEIRGSLCRGGGCGWVEGGRKEKLAIGKSAARDLTCVDVYASAPSRASASPHNTTPRGQPFLPVIRRDALHAERCECSLDLPYESAIRESSDLARTRPETSRCSSNHRSVKAS